MYVTCQIPPTVQQIFPTAPKVTKLKQQYAVFKARRTAEKRT